MHWLFYESTRNQITKIMPGGFKLGQSSSLLFRMSTEERAYRDTWRTRSVTRELMG